MAGLFFMSSCITQQVDPTADLPTISYQTDISPIISSNCASVGCHVGGSGGELFPLTTYDEVVRYCGVKAGKPHDSQLYNIIRLYTGGAMPPSPNDPLSDEQIASIYVWILQGANNN